MRPIVPEWSGNRDRIEMVMLWVKKHYSGIIDMIVPGGLRWTEGIENGLVEIHNLPIVMRAYADAQNSEHHFGAGFRSAGM